MMTPFERTGGLTTWADETAFLDALTAAAPDRVTITEVWSTPVKGRPVRLVRIATPDTPAEATGPLLTAYVHGNEPAPREWALALIRDLALTDSAEWTTYLDRCPVHIIPTVSADVIEAPTRANAAGVNINRDHFALTQPETRAIWEAVAATTPDMVVDMHEYHAYWTDISILPGVAPATAPAAITGADQLAEAVTAAGLAAGVTVGPYLVATESTMTATSVPLARGIPAITPETPTVGPTLADRVAWHRIATYGLLAYHRDHTRDVRMLGTAARRWTLTPPRSGFLRWGNATNEVGGVNLPESYRVTAAQWSTLAPQRAAHGITGSPDGDGWLVPLLQPARQVIPFLLDPSSPYTVTAGERVGELVPTPRPPSTVTQWGPYRRDGENIPVSRVQMMTAGSLLDVWP